MSIKCLSWKLVNTVVQWQGADELNFENAIFRDKGMSVWQTILLNSCQFITKPHQVCNVMNGATITKKGS